MRPEILKLIVCNTGETREARDTGKTFLTGETPTAQEMIARLNKWDYIKAESFSQQREAAEERDSPY